MIFPNYHLKIPHFSYGTSKVTITDIQVCSEESTNQIQMKNYSMKYVDDFKFLDIHLRNDF